MFAQENPLPRAVRARRVSRREKRNKTGVARRAGWVDLQRSLAIATRHTIDC
ncbi:hypothetical protein [Chamaesiphon minutus]|uniref:hypothetical protein n=1 Tax=Chamaesiphon minutus TaxID=1173032 RepID=UPI0012FC9E98|nr:hypothetical protein [Chamaesiphon minutus]